MHPVTKAGKSYSKSSGWSVRFKERESKDNLSSRSELLQVRLKFVMDDNVTATTDVDSQAINSRHKYTRSFCNAECS